MRTEKNLSVQSSELYPCELEFCPFCNNPLEFCDYHSGRKTVQKLSSVLRIAYRPKYCPNEDCVGYESVLRSSQWQQIAPLHCTYGFDVIAKIGLERQTYRRQFGQIHADLSNKLQISESEVRHLYTYRYLPLIACHEREHFDELKRVSDESGLILTLDGLAPEGGEAQLWVVRELHTNLTLRSGWMSGQDHTAFENFLRPIADLNLHVVTVLSDKQQGLVPAIKTVFPKSKHAYCQSHYLGNIAEPIAEADETMKVELRKAVRKQVGDIIRKEQVEQPGVLTVTGLLPSPIGDDDFISAECSPLSMESEPQLTTTETPSEIVTKTSSKIVDELSVQTQSKSPHSLNDEQPTIPDPIEQERQEVVTAIKNRVRYLLRLKGRPPFSLAGIEMVERLTEVADCLKNLIAHAADGRLIKLQQGIQCALKGAENDYKNLRQAADWLDDISDLLDPEDKPQWTGEQVKQELFAYLDQIVEKSQDNPVLSSFAAKIYKTTQSYESGLFHTYDIPDLPRTNNDRESEFRELNRQLLMTTGQKGATKRMILRSGAWELIPRPDSFDETVEALSNVEHNDFVKERERIKNHRGRFSSHTRSPKQSQKWLKNLTEKWLKLPPKGG